MNLAHEELLNYYTTNFTLMKNHQFSLSEIEDMMPFEREIYLNLLNDHIKSEQDQLPQ